MEGRQGTMEMLSGQVFVRWDRVMSVQSKKSGVSGVLGTQPSNADCTGCRRCKQTHQRRVSGIGVCTPDMPSQWLSGCQRRINPTIGRASPPLGRAGQATRSTKEKLPRGRQGGVPFSHTHLPPVVAGPPPFPRPLTGHPPSATSSTTHVP